MGAAAKTGFAGLQRAKARRRAWIAGALLAGSPLVLFQLAAFLLFPWARHLQAHGSTDFIAGVPSWVALALSPFALLVPTLLGFVWLCVRCAAARTALPLLLLVLWPLTWGLAQRAAIPCLRYSNAAWCGHACDDDPCACPHRHLGQWAYGPALGCEAETGRPAPHPVRQ